MNRYSILKGDCRRFLFSSRFWISFFIAIIVLLRPLFGAFGAEETGSFINLMTAPFGVSDFSPFAAIFVVIPFADSFCDDYLSGYITPIVMRVGVKRYSREKCFTTALSGGLLMALVIMSTLCVCAVLATEPDTPETVYFMAGSLWDRMGLTLGYGRIVLAALKVLLGFLFGCLWALVGLCVSVFVTNRYVTLIAPFVIYQFMWFLLEESPFNPVYVLRGDSNLIPSFSFLLIYQTSLIATCAIISIAGIRKKVTV